MSNTPQLEGETVLVIGGSSGIGLETARRARRDGASMIITGRDPERLQRAAAELGASTAAFDANDSDSLARFFAGLAVPIDHLLLSGPGPRYTPFAELDPETAHRDVDTHLLLPLQVARLAAGILRPGGCLILIGGTGGRNPEAGPMLAAITAALPAMTRSLALELAPVRVNLIAPGFVDTPLSARLLGDELDARREGLRATLPIRRVVGPADVAALAVHLMTNTAITGATFDIDGGQQLTK
jgi:NAD(P)-dependent dehydrogenase (short-subunit alcohol dehydrogenase family)